MRKYTWRLLALAVLLLCLAPPLFATPVPMECEHTCTTFCLGGVVASKCDEFPHTCCCTCYGDPTEYCGIPGSPQECPPGN